ncbi:MAG TPA: glycine betaine ABC transporter substrate-binding protein, partial [Thermoanaerobaculia bacterium]
IVAGSLDTYVEYSGTALTAILHQPITSSRNEVDRIVQRESAKRGLVWGPNLGFNNTFAMLVRKGEGLARISDLERVADRYQPGFGYEFVERPDGWPGLQKAYGFAFAKTPKTMDLGLTYRALAAGEVDLIAGNSTDGLIEALGLVMLEDDRGYFPPYDAAVVMRRDIDRKCPGAMKALGSLGGKIDDGTIRRLNYEIDGKKRDVAEVVREFLAR